MRNDIAFVVSGLVLLGVPVALVARCGMQPSRAEALEIVDSSGPVQEHVRRHDSVHARPLGSDAAPLSVIADGPGSVAWPALWWHGDVDPSSASVPTPIHLNPWPPLDGAGLLMPLADAAGVVTAHCDNVPKPATCGDRQDLPWWAFGFGGWVLLLAGGMLGSSLTLLVTRSRP